MIKPAAAGPHVRRRIRALMGLCIGLSCWPWLGAHAGTVSANRSSTSASLRFCDLQSPLTAAQQSRLLDVAALLKRELDGSGQRVALVARSGLALQRFGIRYTHAGISLKDSPNGPWSVRQLYYACDESRSRLYDQGVAGFVSGTSDPARGFVSVLLLPAAAAADLERAALDTPRAQRLLGGDYSANAHAFATRYQNCNQWLAELLAEAWGGDAMANAAGAPREAAQRWLAEQGYVPSAVALPSRWWMLAAGFVPWLRSDDHPAEDLQALRFRTSLPAAIEAFVRQREPAAERIELCHVGSRAVIRRGWTPLTDACEAAPGDRVVALDAESPLAPSVASPAR